MTQIIHGIVRLGSYWLIGPDGSKRKVSRSEFVDAMAQALEGPRSEDRGPRSEFPPGSSVTCTHRSRRSRASGVSNTPQPRHTPDGSAA